MKYSNIILGSLVLIFQVLIIGRYLTLPEGTILNGLDILSISVGVIGIIVSILLIVIGINENTRS